MCEELDNIVSFFNIIDSILLYYEMWKIENCMFICVKKVGRVLLEEYFSNLLKIF